MIDWERAKWASEKVDDVRRDQGEEVLGSSAKERL
jgi:hypothetical protein